MTAQNILMCIGGAIAISVTVAWALLASHGNQPHKGAVRQVEIQLLQEQIKTGFADVKERINDLKEEVKKRQ